MSQQQAMNFGMRNIFFRCFCVNSITFDSEMPTAQVCICAKAFPFICPFRKVVALVALRHR